VFTESLALFENNQNSYKTLKDARVSHYLSKDQPSLSRKDTLQCFKDLENEKTELMIKAYRSGVANLENKQQYQQLCTVQEVRAQDKLFIEKQITLNDYMRAYVYYHVDKDVEVL
jgi:hypothetical protein